MDVPVQTIFTNFTKDLALSEQGAPTSLAFIRNTLPASPLVEDNEIFQVLVIGGSMYRSALVQKLGKELKILQSITNKQPAFITKEDFLSFVGQQLEPNISKLAINFAYPIEPVFVDSKLDGKLIKGTKENTFNGLQDQCVCEEVEKYVQEIQHRAIKASIANDTVCLILSGLTQTSWDHLAAGIVGTGMNFALFLDQNTIVNLESGQYNNFPQTETGKIVDAASNMKGSGLYEKEVSGAYLYQHFNALLKERNINHSLLTDSVELTYLASKQTPDVSKLAEEVLQRSAAFAAVQIAGIMAFKKRSLTFIMQGSLFWKGNNYKEMVKRFVHELSPNYDATFINIDDSDILGAAKLIA